MIVAGIGCRTGVTRAQVDAAIEAAFLDTSLPSRQLGLIAAPAVKGIESGIRAAAAGRGVSLTLVSQSALEAADARTVTRSARSMTAMNVNSVAEAAALAAAGPVSQLLVTRVSVGPVTCALADTGSAQ